MSIHMHRCTNQSARVPYITLLCLLACVLQHTVLHIIGPKVTRGHMRAGPFGKKTHTKTLYCEPNGADAIRV